MERPDRSGGTLPPERAFVVQFTGDTTFAETEVVGRVEHIQSGRTLRFTSLAELVSFLAELLNERRCDDHRPCPSSHRTNAGHDRRSDDDAPTSPEKVR